MPVEWETGHVPDLHVGLPEDSFGHFDAVDFRERDAVGKPELTVADLALLNPEALPMFTQHLNATPVVAFYREREL